MRNTNLFLLLVVFLLILSCFFRTAEGFFNWNTIEYVIPLTKPGPINSVQIQYVGNYNNPGGGPWINLLDLVLLDKNQNRIPYWNGNSYFEGGNWGGYPINHLWDDNFNTMGHSAASPGKLVLNLNPPQEVSSFQITNRFDCCWDRIANYRVVFYQNNQEIGSKHLYQLRGQGQTALYTLIPAAGQGQPGEQGPRGFTGFQGPKGDTGNSGLPGPPGQSIKGNNGERGATGPQGASGPQGPKGEIGDRGETGPQGIQGIQGNRGPQGIQGINGTRGEVGSIGLEGVAGGTCSS